MIAAQINTWQLAPERRMFSLVFLVYVIKNLANETDHIWKQNLPVPYMGSDPTTDSEQAGYWACVELAEDTKIAQLTPCSPSAEGVDLA